MANKRIPILSQQQYYMYQFYLQSLYVLDSYNRDMLYSLVIYIHKYSFVQYHGMHSNKRFFFTKKNAKIEKRERMYYSIRGKIICKIFQGTVRIWIFVGIKFFCTYSPICIGAIGVMVGTVAVAVAVAVAVGAGVGAGGGGGDGSASCTGIATAVVSAIGCGGSTLPSVYRSIC